MAAQLLAPGSWSWASLVMFRNRTDTQLRTWALEHYILQGGGGSVEGLLPTKLSSTPQETSLNTAHTNTGKPIK